MGDELGGVLLVAALRHLHLVPLPLTAAHDAPPELRSWCAWPGCSCEPFQPSREMFNTITVKGLSEIESERHGPATIRRPQLS